MRLPAALVLISFLVCATALRLAHAREAHAGTVQRMELEDLLGSCELALEGRVQNIRVVEAAPKRIETEITLSVSKRFWGDCPKVLVVRVPGGVLPDGRGLLLPGMPSFAQGEELLLFLSEASPNGTRMPVGLAQGRLRVERRTDGSKTLVREQRDLEFVDPRTRRASKAEPRALFDYAAVLARLEAAAQARKAREARGEKR
ncbi:MAG: hypothetical protein IPJ19_17510 [Planctomycetes bacterium]|nr:hypothetical protein [Planctomycetota bacterium]